MDHSSANVIDEVEDEEDQPGPNHDNRTEELFVTC